MESCYQGKWNEVMMGDYVWNLLRDDDSSHRRKPRSTLPLFIMLDSKHCVHLQLERELS